MTTKPPGKVIVTTLGELIEGFCVRLVPLSSLPLILETIDCVCIQAINDENRGVFRYSGDARALYPYPEHELSSRDEEYLFLWWDAFWAWREMLTPHDFETLHGERAVMSDVIS